MSEPTIAPPTPEDQAAGSFLSRAMGVFISPGRAFEAIARKPDFIIPLMVTTVAAIVMTETMLQKIGAERIVRQSLEMSGRADKMTPEQVDQASRTAATFTAALMHVIGVLGTPIYLLVIAAVGLFIVNVIFGGSANFKTAFSVASYAGLVLIIGVVLGLVMILGADLEQFNPDNFVPTTVGFFLNPAGDFEAIVRHSQFVRRVPCLVYRLVLDGVIRGGGEKSQNASGSAYLPWDLGDHSSWPRRHRRRHGIARGRGGRSIRPL